MLSKTSCDGRSRAPRRAAAVRFFRWFVTLALAAALVPHSAGAAPPAATQPRQQTAASPAELRAPAMQTVMVELAAAPVATVYAAALAGDPAHGRAAATRAAQAQLAQVDATQRALLPRLAETGAVLLYRTQRVYNGIAMRVDRDQITALARLPGVKAVHPIIAKTPDLARSTAAAGMPVLLDSLPDLHGENIRIGIIDTGIDYLHVDFGGPGFGYLENDRRMIGDVAGFPGIKIAGGYDFAGETYDADPTSTYFNPTPEPDPDPYDCYGHGTHVAGIAGGYGVTQGGGTYTGAYGDGVDTAGLSIAPGIAPHAMLYALKVFGCTGSSEIVEQAIEWAVDPNGDGDFSDRLDVINMSLGSPYGDAYDTTAAAANNAAAAGVVVVASAGNARDNYFIVGAPSTGDAVISVAATQALPAASGKDGGLVQADTVATFSSRGPRRSDAALKPEIAAPGVAVVSAGAGSGNGARVLSGTSMAAPHVAGAMALLRQLHPDWSPSELKALAMNTANPLITLAGGIDTYVYAPGRIGAGRVDVATAGAATAIAYNADYPTRVGLSFGAPTVVDNYTGLVNVRIANKSAAPVSYTVTYVPVTDQAGVDVETPVAPVAIDAEGTRAFPLLLRANASQMSEERDPTVAAAQGATRAWLSEESGHLMLWPQGWQPSATLLTASGEDGGSATFTLDPATGQLHYTMELTGAVSAADMQVALALDGPQQPVATVSQDGLRAEGTLQLDNDQILQLAAQSLTLYLFPAAGPYVVYGRIASPTPVLHLPVYAAPRVATSVQATAPVIFPADVAQTGQLELHGTAPITTPVALSILQFASPNSVPEGVAPGEIDRYDHADLRYVGAASDIAAADAAVTDATIYFALATYASWSTPNEVTFQIFVDRDEDGNADALIVNSNTERFSTLRYDNDTYVVVLYNLENGQRSIVGALNGIDIATLNSVPLLNSSMVLGVPASSLGLSEQNTSFDYRVVTASADLFYRSSTMVDETPVLHFDLADQPYLLRGGVDAALTAAFTGAEPTVVAWVLNLRGFLAARQPPMLLLNYRGGVGEQATTVDARYMWPYTVELPLVAR